MITMPYEKTNYRESKGNSLIDSIDSYTVIDLETTGLDPKTDKIIELSALRIRNNEIVSEYSTLINPEMEIDSFIETLTGISNDELKKQPIIEEKISEYINFIGNDIVIGHNVNFDINFIYDTSMKMLGKPFENDYIDTLRIGRKYIDSDNHKLGTLAKKLDIECKGAHRAINDCHITNNLYKKLKEIIRDKLNNDKNIIDNFVAPENNYFKNKNIVIKGKINNYGYDEIKKIAVKCGAIILDALYPKTNIVILGYKMYDIFKSNEGGEFIQKIRRLSNDKKIEVISESEFFSILNISLANNIKNKKQIKAKDIMSDNLDFDIDNPFYNKECVFTGTLEKLNRKECMQIIANLGGKNRDNVTSDTNYLVLGNNDYNPILRGKKSNKLIKAETLKLKGQDIEIISENVFYDLIENYI